jgi:uncharacterized damage-inducible protein DinB
MAEDAAMATPISDAFLRKLQILRDRTVPLYDLPAAKLKRRYRRGGWTAGEMLVHISDTESVFLERLRRVAAQDKALLMAIDPDAWHDRLGYAERDLAIAQAQFVAARSSAIELLRRHRTDVERWGVHSEAGKLTLAELAAKVEWHHAHHLEQVERALG